MYCSQIVLELRRRDIGPVYEKSEESGAESLGYHTGVWVLILSIIQSIELAM